MEGRERIIAGLEDLGLSRNEAKVYYVLVTLGESKASEIAKKSGVAREKTYKALKKLKSRGYIKEIKGKPARWIAEPPEKIFSPTIDEIKRRVNEQEAIIRTLEELHLKARSRFDKQEVSVWEIGERDSEQLILGMIKNVNSKLEMVLSPYHLAKFTYGEYKDVLKKLRKKDIDIYIVTWLLDYDIFTHAKLSPYADVYILMDNPLNNSYILCDGESGAILDPDYRCIYFTNRRICRGVEGLISLLVEVGAPLNRFLDLYDAIGEIVRSAPLNHGSIVRVSNMLLERITSEIQMVDGVEQDPRDILTEATVNVLESIFPKYRGMSLTEKLKLLETLFESLSGDVSLEIDPTMGRDKMYITLTIKYDSESIKIYHQLINGKPLYPHPYIIAMDRELRNSGYRRRISLITINRVERKMEIKYLYVAPIS